MNMNTRTLTRTTLALLLLTSISGCFGGGTVTSDDGRASLYIPPMASPLQVALEDISITRIKTSAPVLAYRLEPHGTRFDVPLTFTLDYRARDGAVPYVLHISDGVAEVPEGSTVTMDTASGRVHVEAQIDHFSTIGVATGHNTATHENFFGTVFVAKAPIPPDTTVGNKIPYSAKISTTGVYWPNGGVVMSDTMQIKGDIYVMKGVDVVSPGSESNRPPRTQLPLNGYTVRTSKLKCVKPGTASIQLWVNASFDYVAMHTKGIFGGITIDKIVRGKQRIVLNTPVRCVAASTSSQTAFDPPPSGGDVVVGDPADTAGETGEEGEESCASSTGTEGEDPGSSGEPPNDGDTVPVNDESDEPDYSVCAGMQRSDCYNCCEENFYGSGFVAGCILANACY